MIPPVEPELESRVPSKPVLRDDPKFAAGKIAVFQYIAVAVFLFLISGFWDLQVRNPQFYNEQAERNRIKSLPILAPRGKILDRDGRLIVDNHSSFTLILSRENLKLEHLRDIAEGLHLDYNDLIDRLNRYKSRPKYEPIVIKEELTPEDLAFVESHRDNDSFPEMELIRAQRRLYPQNGMCAHVIGYTGEISESELDSAEFAKYNPGDVIGKSGIEREYNNVLMGIDGERQVVVDNRGRERQVLGVKDAIPGKDLKLTIDLDLQSVAELAMDGKKGAVVALDPRNGEVLAMVSRPTFDPNKFAVRIKPSDWNEIADNPDHPLLDRVIQAQLAPGSTFKPVMALAGLESSTVDDKWTVHCGGGVSLYGHYFKCWNRHGHGTISMHRAIAQSCDVYFYTLGVKMGIDTIAHWADEVGFGQKTGIDLPQEKEGLVPSPKWKLRNFRQRWYPGETPSVSIGQGALIVTPLQLARAIGGIAMGGVWYTPHLLKSLTGKEKTHVVKLNPEDVKDVVDGMYGVVNEGGTGVRARIPGLEVCGKTGSAQLASNQFLKGTKQGRSMRDNAWFVGFAPRSAPEIVVVALFEGGEHGQFAAPIVRDVIKAYFDKKSRLLSEMERLQPPALPLEQPPAPSRNEEPGVPVAASPIRSHTVPEYQN